MLNSIALKNKNRIYFNYVLCICIDFAALKLPWKKEIIMSQ